MVCKVNDGKQIVFIHFFPLASFIFSYILYLNDMALGNHLYIAPLTVLLMQLSGMYRIYPMLVKEDYEFNIDPDGVKFFLFTFLR